MHAVTAIVAINNARVVAQRGETIHRQTRATQTGFRTAKNLWIRCPEPLTFDPLPPYDRRAVRTRPLAAHPAECVATC